jgi:hypothetical protein
MFNPAKFDFSGAATAIAVLFALMVVAPPARAADPVYPLGSRIGLVPPTGMVPSKSFEGFEDVDKGAAILITALPAAAYADMEKAAVPELLKKGGITVEKREPLQLKFGKGFLIVGTQVADKTHFRKWVLVAAADDLTALVSVQVPEQATAYPDTAVRAALATLSLRATVPDAERLSLLPFTVGDLSGFHVEDVLPGRALLLTDAPNGPDQGAPKDMPEQNFGARLLISAMAGGPAEADDRAHFARLAFDTIGGVKNVQITMSEPLRIGGQPGFQTMAQAKAVSTDANVMVVQWLRFGTSGFLQMIGVSRAEAWTSVLSRLRAVRDSIEPK